ncbi:MAG: glycosyltransferase [Phormidesmis sp.]
MKILFLDQSGQLGGAELCLADIAQYFSKSCGESCDESRGENRGKKADKNSNETCLVGVFESGDFPAYLRQRGIPVSVLATQPLQVRKQSGLLTGVKSLNRLIPLIKTVVQLSHTYDLIYANTQKALVVGAIASYFSRTPLVYHLHDIVSPEHFSRLNRQIIVTLANQAALVIANSEASRSAFLAAGGRAERIHVVYNGFDLGRYKTVARSRSKLRAELDLADKFVVGHFSRLSPWKGQHVLIEALQYCSSEVIVIFVGSDLFGESDYVQQLKQQIEELGLGDRIKFLGFRSDIPELMSACDLIAHTSTAAEPFGRVIVEGMLCDRPVVAAAAGGALEIIEHGQSEHGQSEHGQSEHDQSEHDQTGWLTPPGDAAKLAEAIQAVCTDPQAAGAIARRGQQRAQQRFGLKETHAQINRLIKTAIGQLATGK